MKKATLALSVLLLAAAFASARAHGAGSPSSARHGFSSRGGFSRKLSRPSFTRSASRSSFAGRSLANGRATFAGAKLTGGTGGSTPASPPAQSPSAAVGAKVLTLGQAPIYSNPGGGGTSSVDGGGFVAIDPGHANDVGRGPGITWGTPDKTMSTGAGGGSGASSNGPAFDPSF